MFRNTMIFLAGGVQRVHVDERISEMRQVMQELMPHFRGNGMALGDRQMGTDGNIQFRMQPMPHPPDAHLGDLLDLRCVLHRVSDLLDHRRVNPIQ